VFPGKLSVTRTLGDIEAKDRDFQGIPECVWFEPEISKFTIDKNDDFLFLGCDGIF
jgi:serine/threonine protein phosphatase PrpC